MCEYYHFISGYKRTIVPSIADVKDGFWVDNKGQFTKVDIDVWIPPSQIRGVQKFVDNT